MNSTTGSEQTYEAADQRTSKSTAPGRYETGPANAHNLNDPKDQRSLNNRAALEIREQAQLEQEEREPHKIDPTAPAKEHGNRPSRGAEIDKELQEDDERRLQEKGQA